MQDMSKKDLYIKAKSSATSVWVRPSDWLPLPTVLNTEQKFVGLHAVIENGDNYVSFSFTTNTGDYQVDWGDGTVTTHASSTKAQYQYDYNTYDITNSTLSTRGYKQVIITITPVSGVFTQFDFGVRFDTIPAQNQTYSTGWLECKSSTPNAISGSGRLRFGTTTISPSISLGQVRHSYLESFELINIGSATVLRGFFLGCAQLQNVVISADTSNLTDIIGFFDGCSSLSKPPLFDTSNVSLFNNIFQGCSALIEVPLYNLSSATVISGMFDGCDSLREIPLFNTSNVTNMLTMFIGCNSLQKLPLLDTSNVTNMTSMIRECSSINYIPPLSTIANPTMNTFLFSSNSVNKCDMIFRTTVDIRNCQFSQQELVHIFNNLFDRTSLTAANINITGNWGASALTLAERAIATSKNWTITG